MNLTHTARVDHSGCLLTGSRGTVRLREHDTTSSSRHSIWTSQDQATIQVLHKRLHERERTIAVQNYQIAVMSSQLEALNRIDQDTREQRRPVRNLMNVTP